MAIVDQYSILGHDVPSAEQKGKVSKKRSDHAEILSVSAAIGKENARLGMPGSTVPRFPGEDAGRSLAEMARADFDAALQLLAERAQYITEASGVAIALRRAECDDMLCRARVGSNAPELGALLSMEYGLSGESVRTRQLLRCDDAERDPRVNRKLCRELEIASVVIVPILKGQEAVGIFELLSGKKKAFNERDLSALTRLAEMVATVVQQSGLPLETLALTNLPVGQQAKGPEAGEPQPEASKLTAELSRDNQSPPEAAPATQSEPAGSPKKPRFWSAVLQAEASSREVRAVENAAVPAVLRNLKKCQACGFPISQERTFCVECEEKQWRRRNSAQPTDARPAEAPRAQLAATAQTEPASQARDSAATVVAEVPPASATLAMAAAASAGGNVIFPVNRAESSITDEAVLAPTITSSCETSSSEERSTLVVEGSNLFLSSALPRESWLVANKYILIVLLVVALAIGAIALFH